MSLITYNHIEKKNILETDDDNSITVLGCFSDLNEQHKPKILKTVNVFKNSLTTKNKAHKEIVSNLKKIIPYNDNEKPPKYNNINDQQLKNDMNQTINNTLLLSKKSKEYAINKVIYNAFNHIANPICNNYEDKKFSIELQLVKSFNAPETRNQSVVSKSSIETVFSKRNHANSLSSYSQRKSSVVTSVIEELHIMKQKQQSNDLTNSLYSKKSPSKQKSDNLVVESKFNTNIFKRNRSSKSSLSLADTNKSQSPTDISIMDFVNLKTLNEEYDTALNEDPRVILFPTVNCKNPSSNTQTFQTVRRLSQLSSDENNNFVEDDNEEEDGDENVSDGLIRVQSRYSDDTDIRESEEVVKTILKGKKTLLKGSIKIKNNNESQSLLFSNLKIKLCGYKLIYGHSLLIEKTDNDQITKYNTLSAVTESINGLRITKPFVTKELDCLKDTDGFMVVSKDDRIFFEFLLDSTDFPSTLNCQYGKIEYRLELYSNLVNIGNVVLTDRVVILKTLEPEVCNLIDQNDSVYKLNNALNVNNKRSVDNGQTYKLRYKDINHFGFNIKNLIEEDDYVKKEPLMKYIKEHCKNLQEANYLTDELRQPKLFYDIFLSSKTIILNEPFQIYFSIKKALNCKNDWFITECSLTLEQQYCFPYTKKIVNKDYENATINKKKYKKIFVHSVLQAKPKLSEKKESVLIAEAEVKSNLAIYDGIFEEHKEHIKKNSADSIMPHYDELNILKPEANDEIQNLISVSHKLRISITVECDRSGVEAKGVKLRKQFSMSIPVYVITSSMFSTMILPEYIK